MKKYIFYIVLLGYLFPIYGQTISKDQNNVIGKVYKQINEIDKFKNYKVEEWVASEPLENHNGFTRISNGKQTMILFTEYIAPASRRIVAVLDISMVDKNAKIIMARCRVNVKNDGYIVALAKPTKGDFFKNIIKAWRVDTKANRFISISVNGIDCINDEEGAD